MNYICEEFGDESLMSYNANKSSCIIFGYTYKNDVPKVCLNNVHLDWQDNVTHLGNKINFNLNDHGDIQKKKAQFIPAVNSLFANFNTVPTKVMNHLFSNYCCSLYGSQTWNLRNKHITALSGMYNKVLRRIWGLPYNSHWQILYELSRHAPVDVVLPSRFYNMYHSALVAELLRLWCANQC